jgi:hypothetical protein
VECKTLLHFVFGLGFSGCNTSKTTFFIIENGKSFAKFQKKSCDVVAAFEQVLPAKQQPARLTSFTWWWDKQSKKIKQKEASKEMHSTVVKLPSQNR